MAVSVVQSDRATNLAFAQLFNVVFPSTPTQDNLLVAFLWHDELTVVDVADITSAGWRRMNTFLAPAIPPDFRISVWAKFAGASESTTVSFDLGEINRRVHGWAVEFTGHAFTLLPAEDTADNVTHENSAGGTSNQVDAGLVIPADLLAVSMVGMNGSIGAGSVAFDSGLTKIGDFSFNFRGSGIGFLEGADNQQPTASWTQSRANAQMFVVLGEIAAPPVITPPLDVHETIAQFQAVIDTTVQGLSAFDTTVPGLDVTEEQ